MMKYRLLRERLLAEGVLSPADLRIPAAVPIDDLLLVHDRAVR